MKQGRLSAKDEISQGCAPLHFSQELQEQFNDALIQIEADQVSRYEEKIVRRLLEQWVSELEPSVVRQNRGIGLEIVGLTAVGHNKIVVWRE